MSNLVPGPMPSVSPTEVLTYDNEASFTPNGAVTVTTSGYASSEVIDFGTARAEGVWCIDTLARNIAVYPGGQQYNFMLLASNDPTFGSGNVECLQIQNFGGETGRYFGAGQSTGVPSTIFNNRQYLTISNGFPFTNYRDNIVYRYAKLYVDIAGSGTRQTQFESWLTYDVMS